MAEDRNEYVKKINDATNMLQQTSDLANKLGLQCIVAQEGDGTYYYSKADSPAPYVLTISPYAYKFPITHLELAYAALQGINCYIDQKNNQARAEINESKSKNRLSHILHKKEI